jgi:flagellar biosynthesis/type III secretory pathway chaperone
LDADMVNELINILNKEAAVYEGVLKLSRSKTDTIIAGRVAELEGVTRLEQSMILQMGKLEEQREELVDRLSVRLKVPAEDITVSSLEKLLEEEQAEKLKACRKTLGRVLKELSDMNELNSKLIRSSLDYIDFSINLLAGTQLAGNMYGNAGQASDSKKRNFFDVKL